MRMLLLSLMIFAVVMPAGAELLEISGTDCNIAGSQCIAKDGKYYIEKGVPLPGQGTEDNSDLWARAAAGGWSPTTSMWGLFDVKTMTCVPGTAGILAKYNMSGRCEIGNDSDMDCYANRKAREIIKKFAYIKDPVKRMDVGLQDRIAFDAWLDTQPLYSCGFKGWNAEAVCAGCQVQIGPSKRAVSCEEGLPKMAETKKIGSPEFYQTWKNPMGTAVGTVAGAAGGAFRPFKPVSSGSTKKKTDEESPAVIIGGKYTD